MYRMENHGFTGICRLTRARLPVKKLASVLQHRGPKQIPTEVRNNEYNKKNSPFKDARQQYEVSPTVSEGVPC